MGIFDLLKELLNWKDDVPAYTLVRTIKKKPEPKLPAAGRRLEKPKAKKVAAPIRKTPPKRAEAGVITHYFDKISVGVIRLKDTVSVGQKLAIKGPSTDFIQTITSMQIDRRDIKTARKGQDIGIKVERPVHPGDKVFLV
ncbi:MAG: hypothetical protein PHS37_08840 [Candidatus Omnitrophica bacterium]|nr:hypothetical protein [Candidatus Omnitrophota bacterium]